MKTLILLKGYRGVGKSLFLTEAQRYNVFSLHLRRMWEDKYSNNRILAEKEFIDLEQKTGNRNEWLNVLLPEIQKSIKNHALYIFEGIFTVSEIEWIEKNIQNRKIILIYIYTKYPEKRCELVSKREKVSLKNDTNRLNLGMDKLEELAQIKIENRYDNSFLVEVRDLLMGLL